MQPALALDERDEEAVDEVAEVLHGVEDVAAGARPPAVDDDLALDRVQRGDHTLARQRGEHLAYRRRAQHDLRGARVEPGPGRFRGANPAAHATGRDPQQFANQPGVRAAAEGGVQVHDRDFARQPELLGDGPRIAGVEDFLATADELDGLALHQINRRHNHRRTWMPRSAR